MRGITQRAAADASVATEGSVERNFKTCA